MWIFIPIIHFSFRNSINIIYFLNKFSTDCNVFSKIVYTIINYRADSRLRVNRRRDSKKKSLLPFLEEKSFAVFLINFKLNKLAY